MTVRSGDTIVAIASPSGGGERGVLRLSGPQAGTWVARRLKLSGGASFPKERAVFSARFFDGVGEQPCLVLWMPGPRSYTREDVVELHLPGAAPLLRAALSAMLSDGARAALAGEFTRKAFENGRLDLTRAEGVLELIEASDGAERRAAGELLRGGLSRRVGDLREGLDDLRALAEASLDFDEEDTGHVEGAVLDAGFEQARSRLAEALEWEVARPAVRGLARVGLLGAPNAGKSSLFNALLGAEAALVADARGTTRDTLEGTWSIDGESDRGLEVQLLDFPGLDEFARGTDAAAQAQASRRSGDLDVVLWVVDARVGFDADAWSKLRGGALANTPVVLVWNQVDRGPGEPVGGWEAGWPSGGGVGPIAWVPTSAALDALGSAAKLGRAVRSALDGGHSGVARELSARHAAALEHSGAALERGARAFAEGLPLDLVASELRAAVDALDDVLGQTTPEVLLDRIFGRFCIGK